MKNSNNRMALPKAVILSQITAPVRGNTLITRDNLPLIRDKEDHSFVLRARPKGQTCKNLKTGKKDHPSTHDQSGTHSKEPEPSPSMNYRVEHINEGQVWFETNLTTALNRIRDAVKDLLIDLPDKSETNKPITLQDKQLKR